MLAAEKSYFKEHFDTKINSVKQLWNYLASVASHLLDDIWPKM